MGPEALDALSVDTRRAAVGFDLLPSPRQRLSSIDLVDETEPLIAFDAVIQRRQHAIRPDVAVDPRPFTGTVRRGLLSPLGHSRRFAFALASSGFHASTFLPHFPRRGFAFRAFQTGRVRFRRGSLPGSRTSVSLGLCHDALLLSCGTTQALTPAPVTPDAGLLAYLAHTSQRSASNHGGDPDIALHANCSVPGVFQASHFPSQLAVTSRRIEFVSCGPPVRFRLLPTPPRSDAVTFSYGDLAYPDTDSHRAVCAPSRAHWGRIHSTADLAQRLADHWREQVE